MAYESRTSLLNWINETTGLSLQKLEECGKGVALNIVFGILWQDLPLHKLTGFLKHNVDKPIPIDRLVKMRFQDNFDFVLFSKRYWDQNCSDDLSQEELQSNTQSSYYSPQRPTAVSPSRMKPRKAPIGFSNARPARTDEDSALLKDKLRQLQGMASVIESERNKYVVAFEEIAKRCLEFEEHPVLRDEFSNPESFAAFVKQILLELEYYQPPHFQSQGMESNRYNSPRQMRNTSIDNLAYDANDEVLEEF